MNTLVTGGGGFLGRAITEQLVARGDVVRTFSRGDYPFLQSLGVEALRGDIRDAAAVAAACRGIDCVFHTAAKPGIWGPWAEYYSINTVGTRNVLEGCRQHEVAALVYSSSPSVTFDGSAQEGVDESAPYPKRWLCHYPHTKALAEQLVLQADTPGRLRTVALRPHLIWGPRDGHLVPRLIARAKAGRLRQVGDGTNLIDMVYIDNAVQAHIDAGDVLREADPRAGGKPYFVSQGQPVRCWEWINEILGLAGLPPIDKRISLAAAYRLGGVCEGLYKLLGIGREPPMTRFLAAQLGRSHYFDIAAARRDLNYQPLVSTEEGMTRLADWLGTLGR